MCTGVLLWAVESVGFDFRNESGGIDTTYVKRCIMDAVLVSIAFSREYEGSVCHFNNAHRHRGECYGKRDVVVFLSGHGLSPDDLERSMDLRERLKRRSRFSRSVAGSSMNEGSPWLSQEVVYPGWKRAVSKIIRDLLAEQGIPGTAYVLKNSLGTLRRVFQCMEVSCQGIDEIIKETRQFT